MTCFTLSCDSFLSISDVWPKKHIPRVERKMTLLSDKRESINRLFYLTLDRIWFGISDFESINRFTRLSSTRLTNFVCTKKICFQCNILNTSYSHRLHMLNIKSLEYRRLEFDLFITYKIIHGIVDINFSDFFHLVNVDMICAGTVLPSSL